MSLNLTPMSERLFESSFGSAKTWPCGSALDDYPAISIAFILTSLNYLYTSFNYMSIVCSIWTSDSSLDGISSKLLKMVGMWENSLTNLLIEVSCFRKSASLILTCLTYSIILKSAWLIESLGEMLPTLFFMKSVCRLTSFSYFSTISTASVANSSVYTTCSSCFVRPRDLCSCYSIDSTGCSACKSSSPSFR